MITSCCRPGGACKEGEDESAACRRTLNEQLCAEDDPRDDWLVEDLISTWWRPNFDPPKVRYI